MSMSHVTVYVHYLYMGTILYMHIHVYIYTSPIYGQQMNLARLNTSRVWTETKLAKTIN